MLSHGKQGFQKNSTALALPVSLKSQVTKEYSLRTARN